MQFGGTIYIFFRLHPFPPLPVPLQLQKQYVDYRDRVIFAFRLKVYMIQVFPQPSVKI